MSKDNYGKFSPIARDGFPDYKRGSHQWHTWIDEQENYIRNGFTAGGDTISGRLYFKLNFTKILITNSRGNKVPTFPFYADGLREFYDTIEYCFANEKNFLYGKGRDKGFTYDISALALYEMLFVDYSTVFGIFPGGQSPARENFKKAYSLAFDELDNDFKYFPDISDNKEVYTYGWYEKDEVTGQQQRNGSLSTLTMKLATDPDVGKSGRSKIVLLEEFGEIENSKDLIITSDANMREGAKKFGIIIAGGTSNAMKGGYKDFRDIWHNPDTFGFVKLFCPAQKMYWGYVNPITGASDQEGAKKHREETVRNKLKPGSREMMIEKQNYPFDEDEMFIAISKSPFNPEIASRDINRIAKDKSIQNAIQRGNLFSEKKGGVETITFHIDPINGRWLKFKDPAPGLPNPDVGAVDSYRFGEVEDSDSKGAIIGYRPFQGMSTPGNLVTFIYLHRHEDKDLFFEDCRMSAVYWNMLLLIEKTDEDIFTYMRQHNATRWMKRKPKILTTPWAKESNDFGVYPGEREKMMALEYAVQEWNKYHENIVFVELIDELINFGSKNTDLAMAYLWVILHAQDSIRVLDDYKNKVVKKKKFTPYTIVGPGGRLIVVNSEEKAKIYGD